jgi:hypothetical protein
MGEKRNAYRILVGKPEGKRPLGRPRHRPEDNIKMDLRDIGWGGMDWIHLAQDMDQWRALVNTVLNLRGSTKWWEILEWLSDWRLHKKGSAPWSWLVSSWPKKLHVIHVHSTATSSACTKHTLTNVIQYDVLGAINGGS